MSEHTFSAPPRLYTALEARAGLEYSAWSLLRPLMENLPQGDGHPVLVFPGFTAADRSTVQLRALLRRLGYRTYGWKLGANLGPTPHIVEGLQRRLDSVFTRENQTPMTLIGWSLGGIYARELAKDNPDLVRQVITLGSPIHMKPGDPSAASAIWNSLKGLHDPSMFDGAAGWHQDELPVPSTSVYTRTDGIVHWKTCLQTRGPFSENVEVYGSHCGLGFNPAVAYVVADRLAQTDGQWKRFRSPLWLRSAFPRPSSWKPRTTTAA